MLRGAVKREMRVRQRDALGARSAASVARVLVCWALLGFAGLVALPSVVTAATDVVTTCTNACHRPPGFFGPDIYTTYFGGGENAGHTLDWNPRVVESTVTAELPQGAKMPCNECHVLHGKSTSSIYQFDETRTGGPITVVRDLCEGCHLPRDSATTTAVVVCGLELKKLPPGVPDHADASTKPCSDCHGSSAHAPASHSGGGDCATCHGTSGSHAIHVSASDARGPGGIACTDCHDSDAFPYFATGTDSDASGYVELDETTVCDECHSPGGSYDGVDSTIAPSGAMSVGAKDNWAGKVYQTTNSLQSGKERWCVGCHDGDSAVSGEEPSLIEGVYAPPVAGDESGSYIYGTGWGYYETGHGTPSSTVIPSNASDPGPSLECDDCHDYLLSHVDGDRRTFTASGGTPTTYRTGYRLDRVGGNEPMLVPWPGGTANSAANYRLCTQAGCHDGAPSSYESTSARTTNFWSDDRPDLGSLHAYHLGFNMNLRWAPDWGASNTSRITCVSCHNVHGSKYLGMIHDGTLISDTVNRHDGLRMWYRNVSVSAWNEANPDPPAPEDVTLAMSDGWIWRGGTSSTLCTHCHGNNNTLDVPRALWRGYGIAPVLDWVGSPGYEDDGVDPDIGSAVDSLRFRVTYSDANNDAPSYVRLLIDRDDDGDFGDASEIVTLTPEAPGDQTYCNRNPYFSLLTLAKAGDNAISYRFEASDGLTTPTMTATRTVSIVNAGPALRWTGDAGYVNDGVNPNSGTTDVTSYEFRITYLDADGEAPSGGSPTLYVDRTEDGDYADLGESTTMTPMVGGDYLSGKRFSHATTLTRQLDDSINYYFGASDGLDATQSAVATVTVIQNINFAPSLAWTGESGYTTDGVSPDYQAARKPFYFRAEYTDANDDAPGAKQVWIDLDDDTVYEANEKFDMTQTVTADDPAKTDGDMTNGEFYAGKVHIGATGDGTLKYCFYFADVFSAEATGVHLTDRTLSVFDAIDVPSDFGTIQAAVDDAGTTAGETILVADGSWVGFHYKGKDIIVESINGPASTEISKTGNVVEFNSFSGSGSDSTLRGFTVTGGTYGVYSNLSNTTVEECVIEGNSIGVYHTGLAADPIVVDGCTLRDNTGAGMQTTNGSAITTIRDTEISGNDARGLTSAGGNCTIDGCDISGNTMAGNGGGAYFAGTISPLTITDTTFDGNQGTQGGGIYIGGNASCNATFDRTMLSGNTASTGIGGAIYTGQGVYAYTDVTFSGNAAATDGGGVLANNSQCTYTRCAFVGNSAGNATANGGGAVWATNGRAAFTNATFSGNYAVFNGGAVWTQNTVNPLTYTNCTFGGNRAGNLGGGMYVNFANVGQITIRNCVMWGDDASASATRDEIDGGASYTNTVLQYTDINQQYTVFASQTGNMTSDPLYVNGRPASEAATTAGDYHLQPGSPCEEAASATYAPADDIDGDERPQPVGTGADDMGSDEIAGVGGGSFSLPGPMGSETILRTGSGRTATPGLSRMPIGADGLDGGVRSFLTAESVLLGDFAVAKPGGAVTALPALPAQAAIAVPLAGVPAATGAQAASAEPLANAPATPAAPVAPAAATLGFVSLAVFWLRKLLLGA